MLRQVQAASVVLLPRRAADYAQRICAAWTEAFDAFLTAGHLVAEAKAELPHGEWGKLFTKKLLPFDLRTAQMLMQIAADPRIRTNGSHLPPCWRTLIELSRLDDADFAAGIKTRAIHPTMTRADVQTFRTSRHYDRQETRTDIVSDLSNLIAKRKTFGCIVADPPWPYTAKVDGASAGHYPSMSMDQICALPVGRVAAANCHLFLWVPAPFLAKAFAVLDAWGFDYKSQFVWCKHPPAQGSYWMVTHENLLLGVRGNITSFLAKGERSWLEIKKRAHSEKPDEVRDMIERVSPNPRLELFGRKRVEGWTVCGNEL